MKKYLALIAVFLFSCSGEIESPESILQRLSASSGEVPSTSSGGDGDDSSSSYDASCLDDNSCPNNDNESSSSGAAGNSNHSSSGTTIISPNSGPVSYYGRLKASGKYIVGSKTGNTPVQVRGVSLFWSNTGWGGEDFFKPADAINAMVDDWKAEIIRVPMGHVLQGISGQYYPGSYGDDKTGNMERVKFAIDAAIAKGVYVIIDWHSYNAHKDINKAKEFFTEMASYGQYENVIFEIYNEPVCTDGRVGWCPKDDDLQNWTPTTWTTWAQIKEYANEIINIIRNNGGASSLILVGTPQFSARPGAAVGNFINDLNVGYVFHFYAGEHKTGSEGWDGNGKWDTNFGSISYQQGIENVLNQNKPVFVSEYGTVNGDGDGEHNESASNDWHSFMDLKKISSCAWSLSAQTETSAFFKPSFDMTNWTNTAKMNPSGVYIYNKLRAYASSAPWRNGSNPEPGTSSNSGGGDGGGSSTFCKDGLGRDYYCEWGTGIHTSDNPGCFALDQAYEGNAGKTCATMITECKSWGYLYVDVSINGVNCNGTKVN
jgi:Endoglucanase